MSRELVLVSACPWLTLWVAANDEIVAILHPTDAADRKGGSAHHTQAALNFLSEWTPSKEGKRTTSCGSVKANVQRSAIFPAISVSRRSIKRNSPGVYPSRKRARSVVFAETDVTAVCQDKVNA